MSKICPNCGKNVSFDKALFCPGCGHPFKFETKSMDFDWIDNILMVRDEKTGKKRVSKAKLAGIIIFMFFIMSFIVQSGYMLRWGSIHFIFNAFVGFVCGLFYYCVCRGIGYIIRKIRN
jgi:hypothetical protein